MLEADGHHGDDDDEEEREEMYDEDENGQIGFDDGEDVYQSDEDEEVSWWKHGDIKYSTVVCLMDSWYVFSFSIQILTCFQCLTSHTGCTAVDCWSGWAGGESESPAGRDTITEW